MRLIWYLVVVPNHMERFNVSNIQMIVSLNRGIHVHCDVIRPEAVPESSEMSTFERLRKR
jgi:hypothetical protein